MRNAISRSLDAAHERGDHHAPKPNKLNTCEGYARIVPPLPNQELASAPSLKHAVNHPCYPTLVSGTQRVWTESTPQVRHVTLATLAPNITAPEVLLRLTPKINWKGLDTSGHASSRNRIPLVEILSKTRYTPIATLACDGFTVMQFHMESDAFLQTPPRPETE